MFGPFDPFRLQSYNCSRQRFFGLPIVLLPCGLYWYDFKGIRFGGILCKCKSQFRLHSSVLSSMHSVCSSRLRSRLFCGHERCSLPEVSITSFLPLQFFVPLRLSESNFLTHIKMWAKLSVVHFQNTFLSYFPKKIPLIVRINCKIFVNLNSTTLENL